MCRRPDALVSYKDHVKHSAGMPRRRRAAWEGRPYIHGTTNYAGFQIVLSSSGEGCFAAEWSYRKRCDGW